MCQFFLICPHLSAHQSQSSSDELMDTSKVEKFFTVWPEGGQENGEKLKVCNIIIIICHKECREHLEGHFVRQFLHL